VHQYSILRALTANDVTTGNTYSIENDYDQPARVFFSQGCEPVQRPEDLEDEEGAQASQA
jgi:centromere protein C